MRSPGRTPQSCGGPDGSAGSPAAPEDTTAAATLTAATACTLLDALPIGIFVTERNGRVHYANAAMRRMLMIPDDAGLADISPATGRTFDPGDRNRFGDLLEAEGEVRGFEVMFTRYDGRQIEVVLNARLRPDDQGCCEGSAEEITGRKNAERALDNLNRMLMEATREAGMAEAARAVLHKAGNILTSVNLTLDDLRDSVRESGAQNLCLLAECVERERGHLGEFLGKDPVGRQLPDLLSRISGQIKQENSHVASGLENLERHCNKIRESIVNQSARVGETETFEMLELEPLVSIVQRLGNEECRRAGIVLENRIDRGTRLLADRLRVVQVLILLVEHYCGVVAAADGPRNAVLSATPEGAWLAVTVAPTAGTPPESDRRRISPAEGEGAQRLQRCLLAARAAGATLFENPRIGFTLHLPTGIPTATPAHER